MISAFVSGGGGQPEFVEDDLTGAVPTLDGDIITSSTPAGAAVARLQKTINCATEFVNRSRPRPVIDDPTTTIPTTASHSRIIRRHDTGAAVDKSSPSRTAVTVTFKKLIVPIHPPSSLERPLTFAILVTDREDVAENSA